MTENTCVGEVQAQRSSTPVMSVGPLICLSRQRANMKTVFFRSDEEEEVSEAKVRKQDRW